jgi:hypothetical protein
MLYKLATLIITELETKLKNPANGVEYIAALNNATVAMKKLLRFW